MLCRTCNKSSPSVNGTGGFRTATGQCHQSLLEFDNLWFGAETGVLPFDAVNNNGFRSVEFFTNTASSTYHALQAKITRRFAKGLAIQAAGILAAVGNPLTQTGPNLELPGASFFPEAPFGSGGDMGRNHFRGPGGNNWDLVLQKATQISERLSLEFRTEVYNLLNHVQFGQPGNLTSDPGPFGQSSSEVRRADETPGARQIQFGLRLRL